VLVISACTGVGGGWLPPDGIAFPGKATLGFAFSCERSSRSTSTNPQPGRLRLELSYTEQGTSLIGTPFSIHGVADRIDPVIESGMCIGQLPPPGGNELIILGTYRLVAGSPAGFPAACAARQSVQKACRFEVIVRDNDGDLAPSSGDFFSIKLTTVTDTMVMDFPVWFYARAGILGGGQIFVD
jgi:hypothetical protein